MEKKLPKMNKIIWSVDHGCGEVVCEAGKKNRAAKNGILGIDRGDGAIKLDSSWVNSPRRDLQKLLDAGHLGYWIDSERLSSWQTLSAYNTTIRVEG